ncbi:hypothetical protein [Mycobacterium terramassiliense]|uniref:hypothetical protein n=1 Tax=Mycobacterium terramassiliense TaxID=1841859 RepID=UPI00097D1277|nr:hypothetical protein [Mycobacterium terramassiliense]
MSATDTRVEEHRDEALRLLATALELDPSASSTQQRNLIAAAQVHAALAQAVAQDLTRSAIDDRATDHASVR